MTFRNRIIASGALGGLSGIMVAGLMLGLLSLPAHASTSHSNPAPVQEAHSVQLAS